ncbi:hypothetical protein [Accumulibacter sp.]|uniref:hypothetical protein n=1 Tax=Accumulibacter sp. TaxID=2053492 RepID=UPI0025D8403B|nr:hypothetical protein [Accumulibacter sp.]MCM8610534.1 hypothetical protein [Accumulibacter sp.]MCM8634434.1 hypothetical protein [Accumulibacter sp.]MCM8641732.1 hypothetical protein [Accumulibacter sp.]
MEERLEIKSPWSMVPMDAMDGLIAEIKDALPSDHPLQEHELFPGIKWAGRPIFIVDDDTTGERLRIDFEQPERWRKTRFKVPAIQVLRDGAEVAAMIERDHLAELVAWPTAGD